MKKLKKLFVLLTAALFCMLPILSQPLTAQASTPTTFYLNYVDNEWRFQENVTVWNDAGFSRELYYMHQDLKDGDIIVINGDGEIDLTVNVSLSNLTVLKASFAKVTAASYDEVHVVNGVTAAINGNIKDAYLYGTCTVNLNNDVANLYISDQNDPSVNVGAGGTVGHVKAYSDSYVYYEFYSFAKGALAIADGTVITDGSKFTTTAPAATTAPATTTTPAAPSAGEYDEVPKTGSFSVSPLWFLGIAAVCMLGYMKLERR